MANVAGWKEVPAVPRQVRLQAIRVAVVRAPQARPAPVHPVVRLDRLARGGKAA